MADGVVWPTEADYAWAEGREAFCVSFVEAGTPEAVLEEMVGGCGTGIVSIGEARKWASEQVAPDSGSAIEAGVVGGWVVTVEANGYTATLADVVRRISKGSRAIVVFRNIHAHTTFLYAVDGVVIRSFDPLLYDDPTPWDGPPLPEESGLDFGSLPMASAFACAERLTRLRFTPDLLDDHADWLAIGHNPLHALPAAGSWPPDNAYAERQLCEDHPLRQTIPNRLFWDKEVCDARRLFLPGWIGWAQLLLCMIAAAPVVALQIAAQMQQHLGAEFFGDLSVWENLLLFVLPFFALVLVPESIAPMIGRGLERGTSRIGRARKTQSRGRPEITALPRQRHSHLASGP